MSTLEIQALGHQSLFTVIEEVALSRWSSAVALTLLLYDTLLTLGDEVEYLWPKKWSIIKVLTHLSRLIAFLCILLNAQHLCALKRSFSDEFCEILLIATGVAAFVSFAMANWILLGRTKALFGDSKLINYALMIYFFLAYSATGVFVVISSKALVGQIFYSPTIHVCGIATRPKTMGFIWVAPMIFETTIFLLTIYKLYQKAASMYEHGSNLIMVLYRDGVTYYLIIICLRGFNLLAWMLMPTPFIFIGIFLLWAIMTIAVTRLQINLVKAVDPTQPSSMSYMLPGLRRGLTTTKTHAPSRNTYTTSRRYSANIQLHSVQGSRQPTQIRIETSIHTITVVDEEWQGTRAKSSLQRYPDEEMASTRPSTALDRRDLRPPSWNGGYAL